MQAEAAELMRQAEAATAELASPVGMFKNLSPDLHSYIPDRSMNRPSQTRGTDPIVYRPGGQMSMMAPRGISDSARKFYVKSNIDSLPKLPPPKRSMVDPVMELAKEKVQY